MEGMTKMKITKDEELNNMDFVERRRSALERFVLWWVDGAWHEIINDFLTWL